MANKNAKSATKTQNLAQETKATIKAPKYPQTHHKTQSSQMRILQSGIVDITHGSGFCAVEPLNLYGCHFGDNCFVGPFVEIQNEVTIGHNCRIQSHSFICSLSVIGDNCFIGHNVAFVNDLFKEGKPSADKHKWRGASVGNNVSIGSNATILPVKICDNVVIGAGSVVTKDITKSGIYAGNPAKKIRDF